MSDGYKRICYRDRINLIESWRQTRLICYLLVVDKLKDKNTTVYNFYPLPGDPTQEEIKVEMEAAKKKDSDWMKKVIAEFRKYKVK